MPDDLRPPPESAHFLYHWIRDPYGALILYEWDKTCDCWMRTGDEIDYSPDSFVQGWSYARPCDPSAVSINPEDAVLVERVARAHDPIGWKWHDKYKDNEHWAANIEMFRAEKLSKASAVLKALSDA